MVRDVMLAVDNSTEEGLSNPPVLYCTFCAEQAIGLNASDMPVCGIPGNHPEEDDVVKYF